jgi:hypothetical protein
VCAPPGNVQQGVESIRLDGIVERGLVASLGAATRASMDDHPAAPGVLLDGHRLHRRAAARRAIAGHNVHVLGPEALRTMIAA